VSVVALAAVSACGSDASRDSSPDETAAATSLTIVVTPDEGADATTYELTCDPSGGDHPQPQQACDAFAAAGAEVFDAAPADQTCAQVYGGPQTASVTGTFEGDDVDASFSRQNGCEIDRWEKLGTTVFNLPLQ